MQESPELRWPCNSLWIRLMTSFLYYLVFHFDCIKGAYMRRLLLLFYRRGSHVQSWMLTDFATNFGWYSVFHLSWHGYAMLCSCMWYDVTTWYNVMKWLDIIYAHFCLRFQLLLHHWIIWNFRTIQQYHDHPWPICSRTMSSLFFVNQLCYSPVFTH